MKPVSESTVVGQVVMYVADYNCGCCKGKYVDEEVIYANGEKQVIHAWKIVASENERVDRIVQLNGNDVRLQKVF